MLCVCEAGAARAAEEIGCGEEGGASRACLMCQFRRTDDSDASTPPSLQCTGLLGALLQVMVVQTAPSVRVSIGEELGLAPGAVETGQMVAAQRALGFDYVFDSNFSADLTIMEEGEWGGGGGGGGGGGVKESASGRQGE